MYFCCRGAANSAVLWSDSNRVAIIGFVVNSTKVWNFRENFGKTLPRATPQPKFLPKLTEPFKFVSVARTFVHLHHSTNPHQPTTWVPRRRPELSRRECARHHEDRNAATAVALAGRARRNSDTCTAPYRETFATVILQLSDALSSGSGECTVKVGWGYAEMPLFLLLVGRRLRGRKFSDVEGEHADSGFVDLDILFIESMLTTMVVIGRLRTSSHLQQRMPLCRSSPPRRPRIIPLC